MKKLILSTLTVLALSAGINAQNVNIPDANFKAYLVGNAAINTSGDTEIQVSEASAFTGTINCSSLSITDLTGIEAFTSLNQLWCFSNSLSSIDVSQNITLTKLFCSYNTLSNLNTSQNTQLIEIECDNNLLSTLDLSQNTALSYLFCQDNVLNSLNVANGNNTTIVSGDFNASNNPNLTCIQVDDVAYSTSNWTNIDATVSYSTDCSCTVNIPDANFKAYLVGNATINTNGDTEIQCYEASAFVGPIYATGMSISDLTGIESFTGITSLHITGNQLTTIDLSQNTALITLNCNQNQLTSLDVTNQTLLSNLDATQNQLTSINVNSNTNLTELYLSLNQLSSIDLSANVSLTILKISDNDLTVLSLSANTDLVELNCKGNLITTIDISMLPVFSKIRCDDNQLTALNLANGNNSNYAYMFAGTNPNLTCIQVDDVAYSTSNWTNIDAASSFSINCPGGGVGINEVNILDLKIYPNPVSNILFIQLGENKSTEMNILSLSGKVVKSIANNNVKSIDVSDLVQGIYILKVVTDKGVSTKRFVKQ
jgi:hypothetical protein